MPAAHKRCGELWDSAPINAPSLAAFWSISDLPFSADGASKAHWENAGIRSRYRFGVKVEAISTNSHQSSDWKLRGGRAGLHAFNRTTGLNILFDEIPVPESLHSRAPRQISIALTNRCDLTCAHCYAPKSRAQLSFDNVTRWMCELDANGTLGVGFGGGEPTIHPEFVKLCMYAASDTRLSVSFTTHAHHVDADLADELRGNVHFTRVSMDGVYKTYESIRGRSFQKLLTHLKHVQSISRFGINTVVNELTLPELDDVAAVASDVGARELLLLPQIATRDVAALSGPDLLSLCRWTESYRGSLKLHLNELHSDGFVTCDPLLHERGLRAYAHIDASGLLKHSSYQTVGVLIGEKGVMQSLSCLHQNYAPNSI